MSSVPVLILDFGSQYTQLIARRVRELGVYCEIHPCTIPFSSIEAMSPQALVLSGGPSSVFEVGAPDVDARVWQLEIPMLGVCYGMQLMCHRLGGKVEAAVHREYGPAEVQLSANPAPFDAFSSKEALKVWMSHGDRVAAIPPGFSAIGATDSTPFAAMVDAKRQWVGIQFHPEVAHTPRGKDILKSFVLQMAKCAPTWTPTSFVEESVQRIANQVGDGRAVCGLSGGVDSTVASVLVSRAIGERLTCIFVDNGLLRKDEGDAVETMLGGKLGLHVIRVNAQERFLSALEGVTDPEIKRKTIGRVFIDVFDEEAKRFGGAKFLVQGTLYPDVIESVSFKGPSVVIKSHHNVGGLPERMGLALVEPLRELFKDEVRAVGEVMEIPKHLLWRHPFPGPGLAVRCLGAITPERLHVLREADAVMEDEIRKAGWYDKIWQAFCVSLPVNTVGVMGDQRTYQSVIAVRAVHSSDGMTADWVQLPYELLGRISTRIINEVKGCNRVVYDISNKPPATIEWE